MQFLQEPTRLVRNIERVAEIIDSEVGDYKTNPDLLVPSDEIINPYLRDPYTGEMSRAKRWLAASVMTLLNTVAPPVEAIIEKVIQDGDGEGALIEVERLGQDEEPFMQYKWRSMHPGTESQPHNGQHKDAEDPRITEVGYTLRKWSLDELAQRRNYKKGNMTLIGPRPEAPEQKEMRREAYEKVLGSGYEARYRYATMAQFMCKPGITGLTQVAGRGRFYKDADGYFKSGELHIVYAEEADLEMEVRIAAETLPAILVKRGAH